MHTEIVIFFSGPRRPKANGQLATGLDRILNAVEYAYYMDAPLIIAGDAFKGLDLERFEAIARAAGVENVYLAKNTHVTHDDWFGNSTRGDAEAVAALIENTPELRCYKRLRVVTDYFHVPRAKMSLHMALLRRGIVGKSIKGRHVFSRRNFVEGLRRLADLRSGEFNGWLAAALDRDNREAREKRSASKWDLFGKDTSSEPNKTQHKAAK